MTMKSHRLAVPVVLALVVAGSAAAAATEPPPEPEIAPLIPAAFAEDQDGDGIEDELLRRARAAEARLRRAASKAEVAAARAELDAAVLVELVFRSQVTRPEIDAFLEAGGEIGYLYRAVSYGWHGSLPLGAVERLAGELRGGLAVLVEAKPVRLHLDEATQTGRVRPIWAPGFAGVPAGDDGDSSGESAAETAAMLAEAASWQRPFRVR